MKNLKVRNRFLVGNKVKIINNDFYAYYGFSDCDLIVHSIKYNNSDDINLDNRVILNLKTLDGMSIEGENNDIWIFEEDVELLNM